MSQPETWYNGALTITPPLSQATADELSALEPAIWTITRDDIECQDGQRHCDAAEDSLPEIVKIIRALGHALTGEIDWTWEGDDYQFGQFVMVDNKLHHRRGQLVLGAPEPAE